MKVFYSLGLFVVVATVCAAQSTSPLVSLSASNIGMEELASKLTKASGIPVVADPGSSETFSGSLNKLPLESVLEYVAKASAIKWRKVYVAGDTAKKDTLDKARTQSALLDQLQSSGAILVYDPAAKTEITYTTSPVDPAKAGESAKALGLKPVYVVSSTARAVKPAAVVPSAATTKYADLSAKQERDFLGLSPEQRVQALESNMMREIQMNPTDRMVVARARAQAYRTLNKNNSATLQQWRAMRRDTMKQLRDSGQQSGSSRNRNNGSRGQSSTGRKK